MKTLSLLILALFVQISNVNSQSDEMPKYFECGQVIDGKIDCPYFKFIYEIPQNWVALSDEDMSKIVNRGVDPEGKEKDAMKPIKKKIKTKDLPSAFLLWTLKYEFGSSVLSNPNIIISIDNLSFNKDIQDVAQFQSKIFESGNEFNITMEYVNEDFNTIEISGVSFRAMDLKSVGDYEQYQTHLTTFKQGFALTITLAYTNQVEKEEMMKSVEGMKFY